ncbi:MAG: ATP-binding protein [Candidatus Theseobacter exili]|nr:ATP-binding protein [Candidatus Theseobacter exili]
MKEYKINVDPRILELLGPNLYTNIYYVLAELIANAYDADAKNVYITANPTDIRVEDDGHGMSYENGEIEKYLNVAGVSRTSEDNSLTRNRTRRKMGRKGVGKLAALSVSESVDVLTIANEDKSGFILNRIPLEENKLEAIPEEEIKFDFINKHGTLIIMKDPQYRLHKTLKTVKRNLIKIFPLINKDFRIHISRGNETEIIDDFDRSVMTELCALITLGESFRSLADSVPNEYPNKRSELAENISSFTSPIIMKDINGQEKEYILELKGWIGAYKSTRGRKAELTDFPDNFISLFANQKMGEFNILPAVGQNKLIEVFIVGQLHIDLFELSELPDIALSNRQGYKSDDPRYIVVLDFVRNELLPKIVNKRKIYADEVNKEKEKRKIEEQKKNEEKLKKLIDKFRTNTSNKAAQKIKDLGMDIPKEVIEKLISESINDNSPDLGIKSKVDSQKKKVLISQTLPDKLLSDIIYKQLLFNNIPEEDILYTNCDDEICRVPEAMAIYDYLREFFVESYSTQKIYVLFVTSDNTKKSWGAITEVGAAWITQIDHKIFNISPFRPEHPLDNEQMWHTTNRDTNNPVDLSMSRLNADIFCQKIDHLCDVLEYRKKTRAENRAYLETLISIV